MTTAIATPVRLVGVEIRASGYGFVVLEGLTVLDSGIRTCSQPGFDQCLGDRFLRILRMYDPTAVIVRGRVAARSEKRSVVQSAIRKVVKQQGSVVVVVGPAVLQRFFRKYNGRTKYDVAQCVANLLPDLAWKLPRKRRAWHSEDHRTAIFDAAAAALVHLMHDQQVPQRLDTSHS